MTDQHARSHRHADLDVLADLVAGEATPAQQQDVAACATCTASLAALEAALAPVGAALAALPEPPLPAEVAARLDAVLLAERTGAPIGAPAPPPLADVVPLSSRRRSWAGPAAGIAAASVLVLGGVLLAQGSSGSNDSTSADTAAGASSGGIATSSTGTAYTKDPASFTAALPGLLSGGAETAAKALIAQAPVPSGATGGPAATNDAAVPADPLARLRDPQQLAGCLTALSDPGDDTLPLALDYASFEGQPAVVVLLPTSKAGKVDVYVVGAACTQADASLLFFTRVDAP